MCYVLKNEIDKKISIDLNCYTNRIDLDASLY
jgi:hypothetical protein